MFSSLSKIFETKPELPPMKPKFDQMLVKRADEEFEFGYRSHTNLLVRQHIEYMDYAIYITKGLGFNTKIEFIVGPHHLHIEVNAKCKHDYRKNYKNYQAS
ncbi:hypothetical protein BCR42DRAFT_426392 [Absidia repens]|uniref:Uncharacterized protein n=1 Tax=Absidia repens TaxID=90262 RepID=A0A1X2I159_9FUNG|nr:hypothetical protein BCR42DRAFT_426392 [Absidia repens]